MSMCYFHIQKNKKLFSLKKKNSDIVDLGRWQVEDNWKSIEQA